MGSAESVFKIAIQEAFNADRRRNAAPAPTQAPHGVKSPKILILAECLLARNWFSGARLEFEQFQSSKARLCGLSGLDIDRIDISIRTADIEHASRYNRRSDDHSVRMKFPTYPLKMRDTSGCVDSAVLRIAAEHACVLSEERTTQHRQAKQNSDCAVDERDGTGRFHVRLDGKLIRW